MLRKAPIAHHQREHSQNTQCHQGATGFWHQRGGYANSRIQAGGAQSVSGTMNKQKPPDFREEIRGFVMVAAEGFEPPTKGL